MGETKKKPVNSYSVDAVEESAKRKGKRKRAGVLFQSVIREGPSEEVILIYMSRRQLMTTLSRGLQTECGKQGQELGFHCAVVCDVDGRKRETPQLRGYLTGQTWEQPSVRTSLSNSAR